MKVDPSLSRRPLAELVAEFDAEIAAARAAKINAIGRELIARVCEVDRLGSDVPAFEPEVKWIDASTDLNMLVQAKVGVSQRGVSLTAPFFSF